VSRTYLSLLLLVYLFAVLETFASDFQLEVGLLELAQLVVLVAVVTGESGVRAFILDRNVTQIQIQSCPVYITNMS